MKRIVMTWIWNSDRYRWHIVEKYSLIDNDRYSYKPETFFKFIK